MRAAADVLAAPRAPAIVAGRGAVLAGAGPALRRLGELTGAVLATSAMANGLFAGDPYDLGISGGFASPLAAQLLGESDAIVAFGAALNQWTTQHGALIAPGARVVQVDLDADAIGAHRPADVGVVGDARETAAALGVALEARGADGPGRRTPELADEIAGAAGATSPTRRARRLDPRTLSIALDDLLPEERTVVVDSGHFMGWPSMYLRVPDAAGLRLPAGVPVRRPRPRQRDRRGGRPAGPAGGRRARRRRRAAGPARARDARAARTCRCSSSSTTTRPTAPRCTTSARWATGSTSRSSRDTDFAALAGRPAAAASPPAAPPTSPRCASGLSERDRPLVLDAKVDPDLCAEWLEEAFRGH